MHSGMYAPAAQNSNTCVSMHTLTQRITVDPTDTAGGVCVSVCLQLTTGSAPLPLERSQTPTVTCRVAAQLMSAAAVPTQTCEHPESACRAQTGRQGSVNP